MPFTSVMLIRGSSKPHALDWICLESGWVLPFELRHLSLCAVMLSALLATVLGTPAARAEPLSEDIPKTAAGKPLEGALEPFLGSSRFEMQELFTGGRFPNVVVATDGTVVATWGKESFRVRRSEDGVRTWEPEVIIAKTGIQGGGATVDERRGDLFVFVEDRHPPAPLTVYRSTDHGKTWKVHEVVVHADEKGLVPSMHMNETGITLWRGEHAGRLLRPSRSFKGGQYSNAIYSDDGGKTWHPSAPFPALGTGEAALAELLDGRIYYNSRRHKSKDGLNPRRRHIAYSDDGGETWKNLSVSPILPDGDQIRDYGLMGGLVRLPVRGRDILLFSNIESPKGRRNGVVWGSFDGGKTWPVKRVADEGHFAYSSLAAGRPQTPSEGWIYLQYESGGAKIARFNLTWLLEGKPTGDGTLPDWCGRR